MKMSINLFYHKLKTKSLVKRGFLFLMQILTVKILTKKNPKLFLVKGFSNYLAESKPPPITTGTGLVLIKFIIPPPLAFGVAEG